MTKAPLNVTLIEEEISKKISAEEAKDGKAKVRSADERNRGRKRVVFGICLFLLVAGGLFFYFRIYRVEPAFTEMTYEYGDVVSRDITDYLIGTDWSVQLGELDLSGVDESETGIYEAVVRHGSKEFAYRIEIRDTVPPFILWKEGQVYLATDRNYGVSDVIAGLSDVDREAEGFFLEEDEARYELCFDRVGEYALEIGARDRAGNETRGEIRVIVDTPPAFEGIHDFYIVPGSAPDYEADVTARDDVDGNLTGDIRIDDSEIKLDEEGRYTLRYLAQDSYGLETVEEALVTVASPDEIQGLIGKRRIDYRTDCILGAPNIYDGGASEQEDIEEMLEYMRPALVQLYHGLGGGGYSSGSGYIVEITRDAIYICSNSHVVGKYEDWDVYFFDGTKLSGEKVGVSEIYDVGVAKVALEDVPKELLNQLMTVHIDRTYWQSLDEQEIALALERVDKEGGLIHISTGNLIKVKQEFEWYDQREHTEVTIELVHGDSGSAVLDGYGNLIGMAYAYSEDPIRYWCIPLDGILGCYEEITGRMPYVY